MASKESTRQAKRTQYGAYVTLYVLIVLAALGILNWLADQNNKSFDTTTSKQFSLSEQTTKTVKNLKNDVYLTYFDRSDHFSSARDLLDRYSNLSHKLHVAYVDPEKKPEVARSEGFRSEGGVVVRAGAKTEEAAALNEEGVTNAIIRSQKSGQKTVCFVSGSGEAALDDQESGGASFAKEQLEKNTYKTTSVNLLQQPVPADCAAVIVGGPKRDYLDPETAALKTYLDNGGHVLLSLGPAIASQRGGPDNGQPLPNIEKLAADWGVTFDHDLVLDPGSRMAGFSAAAPLAVKYESQPIVRDLENIATLFPLSQSLTIASGKPAGKLFSTSESALAIPKPAAGGTLEVDPATAKKGPFVLGAVGATGTGAKQVRFVAVGSAMWMANQALGITQVGNRDLFLNMVNWLTADEDLISIRPKDPEDRRISLTRKQSTVLFFSTVVFLPLLAIASGIAVWAKRR